MAKEQAPLSMSVRIANRDGTPTLEFMRKWQAQMSLNKGIVSLSTPQEVSGLLDVIDSTSGAILYRTTALWTGLASPGDPSRFLSGSNPPSYAQIKDSDLSLSDVVTNDVSTLAHGFAPKAPNDATKYLDGSGAYSVPPITGDMLKATYDTNNDGVVDAAATAAALTGTQAADIVANNAKVSDINHVAALLPNVDNTSDANKPVSTAQQAALDAKEPSLGNPAADGDVLASTAAGVRSWVTPSSGGGGATTFTGLTDTPAALGTAGQVAVVNAAATALEFVTPASGGGGATPAYDIGVARATKPGNIFTAINGGVPTANAYVPTYDSWLIRHTGNNALSMAVVSGLSADGDVVFKLHQNFVNSGFPTLGVVYGQASTGRRTMVGLSYNDGFRHQFWNGTAYVSEFIINPVGQDGNDWDKTGFVYYKINRTGTVMSVYTSHDGLNWILLSTGSTTDNFMSDVDQVGFGLNSNGASASAYQYAECIGFDTSQQTSLMTGGGGSATYDVVAANYTVVSADLAGGVTHELASASNLVVTVPAGLSGSEPLAITQGGVGKVGITAGAGVTINAYQGNMGLKGQYAKAVLTPTNVADSYLLTGDLQYAVVSAPSTAFDTISANVTPVAGWGTVLRNSAYTGPAMRVGDTASSAQVDISFDANGRITSALPYGANTRVVTLYDQFGTDDLTTTVSAGIIAEYTATDATWHMVFTSVGFLQSTKTVATAAWAVGDPLWSLGFMRTSDNSSLQTVWGVPSGSGFMDLGMWLDLHEQSYRINGSNPYGFAGTNWTTDATAVQNQLSRVIGDDTQGTGTSYGYFNGTMVIAGAYSNPIVFDVSTAYLGIGGNPAMIGAVSNQTFWELTIFTKVAAATGADIVAINTALGEALV